MQVDSALLGVSAIPRRRRLNVVLAILVVAAMVALLVWATPLATSGAGVEEASPKAAGAGSATYYPLPHGKVADAAGVGSAVLHEDAGNVNR